MSSRCSCRRPLSPGLIALTLCLCGVALQTRAQDTDSTSKQQTSTPGSVVLPPTNTRPTAPLAMPQAASKPHPIVLPLPPDEPTPVPARKTVAKKPAPAVKKAATPAPKPAAVATKPAPAPAVTAMPSLVTNPPIAAKPAAIAPAVIPPAPAAVAPAPADIAPITPTPTPQADADALGKGANTFGFYAGETRDQIIAAIGKDNVLKQSGDILEVAASPKPDPNFDSFLLIVGPQQGLVKIIATGKDIDGDPAGHAMKEQFNALKTTLGAGYGEPSDNFDFLDVKAKHRSPNQFMLSLTDTERTLAVYWTKKDFGNQITSISLNGNGLGNEKGYLSLEYEFAGYHAYLLAKK